MADMEVSAIATMAVEVSNLKRAWSAVFFRPTLVFAFIA
jgi:hypothetical protein